MRLQPSAAPIWNWNPAPLLFTAHLWCQRLKFCSPVTATEPHPRLPPYETLPPNPSCSQISSPTQNTAISASTITVLRLLWVHQKPCRAHIWLAQRQIGSDYLGPLANQSVKIYILNCFFCFFFFVVVFL